ncbi:glycoside hydrolase family 43 protein [Wenyingzhuangia sp. IMCC45467]
MTFIKRIITFIFIVACCGCKTTKKSNDKKEPKVAYLAAYMKAKDEKHMYYAIATDEFLFKEINNGKPILSASFDDKLIRDPMVFQDQKGIYHMVATVSWKNRPLTVWDSNDLIHWENERLVDVAPKNASKTWAPELAYDEENDLYFIYWTAEINNEWKTASIYYATTKDFIKFSEPKILYSDDSDGILDANIIKVNGLYKLIYRKNGIWVASSKNALGPYSDPYQLTKENVEGPYAFRLNNSNEYGITWDYYRGNNGFGLLTSPDFKNWERVTNHKKPYYNENVEFPSGIRHGSIIGITQKELEGLLKTY